MQTKPVFELLYEASKAIASEIELQKVVQRVTDIGRELAGAQFGAFFYNVIDQKGESYILYTISGVPREAFSKFPMPRNTKIFEPTFSARGTVRYDDVTKESHYGENPPYHGMPKGHLPVRSYLAVPVVSPFTQEAIGGLFFGHSETGVFTEESEKLIEGVAVQAAIAITNARLFEEKKRTEEKLVEQREQYRSIFNATSDSAIIYDENGTIVEVNPAACQVYGYSYDELIGLNASKFFKLPEDFIALKEIALSGREYSGKHARIRKDGSLVEVEFKGVRFIFRDKPHVLSISKDITSEKKTKEALQQSEKLSNLVMNASPVTLWMTDAEGETIYINQTWIDWVGGTIESQLGNGWLNCVLEADRDRVRTEFRGAFTARKQFISEYQIRRKTGEVRWCFSLGSPYYNKDGSFSGYAGSVSDIDDRKKVEERLASQNSLINTITNNTLQALFLMNDKQVCTYMNPAAEQMTGYRLHEVQEKPLHYYIHHTHPDGRHFPIEDCAIDRALPTQAQTKGEEVFIHKDGHFYPVAFIASPIVENGIPIGTVIEARDTTEEKRIEQELRSKEQQAMQMLEEKVRERTYELEQMNYELLQFASVASHDLKEPVRKIAVFSKILRDRLSDSLDASAAKYLRTIVNSADRMAVLIDDLLSFSRLSNSKVEFENADLNKIVNQVITDLELPIKENHAVMTIGDLPIIKGIPLQLGQLFQNLISNSLKFAQPERQLHITIGTSTAELDGKLAIKLIYCDNGIGFKQNQAEKIFEIFYRLHSKDQYEGTGIGLAIVKKIVDFHKGEIRATGKEGEGACFEIVLPAII
ncbi:PAS domain S-box protein [Flavisolibacter nicotianae]|uniref:PAS domain S-box protein n=1 Tax=Flavisolibacter nicotianae TaxID=2364882 RepID=UPI0019698132|nr:PAS domain S-box protein [Flavisolibacter nicotianae]